MTALRSLVAMLVTVLAIGACSSGGAAKTAPVTTTTETLPFDVSAACAGAARALVAAVGDGIVGDPSAGFTIHHDVFTSPGPGALFRASLDACDTENAWLSAIEVTSAEAHLRDVGVIQDSSLDKLFLYGCTRPDFRPVPRACLG